jgi:CheY-like chemotaxis protein
MRVACVVGTESMTPMLTVLVIDDHEYMRALLRAHLEGLDCRVMEARDGATGLRALEYGGVDVLVTDILMPGEVEGIEVIATARERDADLPIIAISAGGKARAEGYLDAALALGASACLGKPFDREDLLEVVRSLFPDRSFAADC